MGDISVPDNFLGLLPQMSRYEGSTVVVLPVPFEITSSWLTGSAFGPKSIIEASKNLELYDIETACEPCRMGIFTHEAVSGADAPEMVESVSRRVGELLRAGKFVVTLGGEHTVSVAPIKAHSEFYSDLSILHLDAHSDMRDSYLDNPYSHACAMARAGEFVPQIVSVGIRSMDSAELPFIKRENMFFAHEIYDGDGWMRRVVERLSSNVYISIDLDVFDPAFMPSTGTPEPGGLGWYQVMNLFKEVIKVRRVVGFDVVELSPSPANQAPDFLAAKLIYRLLAEIFRNKS